MVSYINELSDNGNKFKIIFREKINGNKIKVDKLNTKSLHVNVVKPEKVFRSEASVVKYFKTIVKSNNLKLDIFALRA